MEAGLAPDLWLFFSRWAPPPWRQLFLHVVRSAPEKRRATRRRSPPITPSVAPSTLYKGAVVC
jgi:hypothetical protein